MYGNQLFFTYVPSSKINQMTSCDLEDWGVKKKHAKEYKNQMHEEGIREGKSS